MAKKLKKFQPGGPTKEVSLTEKVKIAKQLYKDNPGKVYLDAVIRAEKNLADSLATPKKVIPVVPKKKK
jgi:hypothetical protein